METRRGELYWGATPQGPYGKRGLLFRADLLGPHQECESPPSGGEMGSLWYEDGEGKYLPEPRTLEEAQQAGLRIV